MDVSTAVQKILLVSKTALATAATTHVRFPQGDASSADQLHACNCSYSFSYSRPWASQEKSCAMPLRMICCQAS